MGLLRTRAPTVVPALAPPDVAEVLARVHAATGTDFSDYRTSTLVRRIGHRHDLTFGEAPATVRFHLVSCRNVLIYFSPALQRRVLRSLVDALEPGGHLCLGEAEWPDDETLARVTAVDRERRIFSRPGVSRRAACGRA